MKRHYLVKRKKGQLIVFGVLIFPVIFICLAMVINVGMVVHDKINLQNSVDLAAIYAAQKQAEVMDAMAHINYQMRQSYKLLAWRYLVLGNSGAFVAPTLTTDVGSLGGRGVMNILNRTPGDRMVCPNGNGGDCRTTNCDYNKLERCPYAVCTVHPLVQADWYDDNTHVCQSYMFGSSARRLPPVTSTVGILPTLSVLAGNDQVRNFRKLLTKNCSDVGYINWLVATSMYLSFLKDQRQRKLFIKEDLFPLLHRGQDIEGQSIKEGVFKTIRKNLTYVNYTNFTNIDRDLTFQFLKSTQPDVDLASHLVNFEVFYEWDYIAPVLFYVQNTENHSGPLSDGDTTFCRTTVQTIFQCDPNETNPFLRSVPGEVNPTAMSNIVNYKSDPSSPITLCEILKEVWADRTDRVSGFYKKGSAPNLVVKVEVDIPYKGQLFSPFFDSMNPTRLKAVAYAKPFGATFGQPQKDDRLVPRDSSSSLVPAVPVPLLLFPNYSRFPGDVLGLTNERLQWAWNFLFTEGEDSIGAGSDYMRNKAKEQGRTFNNYSDLPQNVDVYKDPMLLEYNVLSTTSSTTVVQLNSNEIFTKQMKIYEEMAIAPDQFDLTYYTILPNYMTTLYPKLKKAFSNQYVPADLGHLRGANINLTDSNIVPLPGIYTSNNRDHTPEFRLNYIEKQIIYANRQPAVSPFSSLGLPNVFGQYKVNSIDQLLTSWAPDQDASFANSNEMYNTPPVQNCILDDKEVKLTFGNASRDHFLNEGLERKMIPSHCLKGGRTGFSVKLIHPSAL